MSLKRRDAMRSRRSRQAIPFTTEEHEKINILIDKNQEKRKSHPESGDKLQEIKQMVTEVTVIMKDNIEKVVEREGKLNTLSVRTEELEASPTSSYTLTEKQRSDGTGHGNDSDELVYRRKKSISDKGLLHEKVIDKSKAEKSDKAQTVPRSSENRGDETLAPTVSTSLVKEDVYRSSQSISFQFQSGKEEGEKQSSASASMSPTAFDIYALPAIVDVNQNNSSILTLGTNVKPAENQSTPALMSPVEIDIYNLSKTFDSSNQNTKSLSLEGEDIQKQTYEVVIRRKSGISTKETSESEPLQRHNAMRSRKNRSGVAFTDTEKSDIISNVEQQTPAEVGHLNKRQKHVSEEVRLQVHEAKLSMEENIAKAEKTEKILDEMDINSPSKMTKCRSLEDITGKKSTEGTLSLTGKDFLTKSENMSSMPTTLRTGTQEPGPDSKSENKRKNKSATTDKSEFKIAYVKKKAKKAKVFLKEKLTYHHSNEEQSKEYRANDGNKAAVFYISEPSASGQDTGGSHHHPNKPTTPSNQQPQQQTKTTQIDVLRGQVREVTNIMKNNVDEMAKRGEKLEDLETRSGHLEDLSNSFTTTAAAIQKKMKRRNRKVICVIAITVTAILLIVAVILLVYFLG